MCFKKIKLFAGEFLRPANLLIISGNLAFIYFWGYKGWGEFEKLSWRQLDFDSLGHFIFGLCWSYILVYWGKTYWPEDYLVTSKKRLAFEIILLVTAFETLAWEICFEWLMWDMWLQPNQFPWLAKAQKGIDDTMLDILITFIGAGLGMIIWGAYRKYFEWRWPAESDKEEIDEEKQRARLWGRSILTRRREHRKQIFRELRNSLRKKIAETKKTNL